MQPRFVWESRDLTNTKKTVAVLHLQVLHNKQILYTHQFISAYVFVFLLFLILSMLITYCLKQIRIATTLEFSATEAPGHKPLQSQTILVIGKAGEARKPRCSGYITSMFRTNKKYYTYYINTIYKDVTAFLLLHFAAYLS